MDVFPGFSHPAPPPQPPSAPAEGRAQVGLLGEGRGHQPSHRGTTMGSSALTREQHFLRVRPGSPAGLQRLDSRGTSRSGYGMWGHSTQQAWGPMCPRWSQPGRTHTRNAGVWAPRASKPAPPRDVDAQLRPHPASPLGTSTPSAASAPLAGQNSPDVRWQPTRRARVAPRPRRVPPELRAPRAALEPMCLFAENPGSKDPWVLLEFPQLI